MLAQIGGQAVDVAAELEQGILGGPAREGSDGHPDRLRLGPPAAASPGVEAFEVPLVEVYLQRSCHESEYYQIMITESAGS